MRVKETIKSIQARLSPIYGKGEARAMTRLIFHSLKGWDATAMIIHEADEVSDYTAGKIEQILSRLGNHEPIQYILGEAYFYGMDLCVDSSTLIPRPETEQLVDMIMKRFGHTPDLRVLDIGTGSGAIAIALSRNLPFSKVTALDISAQALNIAKKNAERLKAKIDFLEADILSVSLPDDAFDIVVSNPPYIAESEKEGMEANVLNFEPHTALFVPDSDPLRFYTRIASLARRSLSPGGMLYFEINPLYADLLKKDLCDLGFSQMEIHKDMYGRDRFISAENYK